MPFIKRSVSPVRLCTKAVSEENKFDLNIICNNALVSALKQLASLAYHAEGLFADLNQECQDILIRTDGLKHRIHSLENHVDKLDFRTVSIPVGDLDRFERLEEHFEAEQIVDRNLFTPSSRPECIVESYCNADPNPVRIISRCNPYRRDGRTGSAVFSPTPTVTIGIPDIIAEERADGKIPMSHGGSQGHARRTQRPYNRPHSMAVLPTSPHLMPDDVEEERLSIRQLSASQPADLVPIDTSGSNFNRMCQYRESLKSASHECMDASSRTGRRRHRRRQTVSGLPNQVHDKLSQAFFDAVDRDARSLSRDRLDRPRSMAYLDRYAPRDERFFKSREELRRERLEREKSVDREEKSGGMARSCSLRRSMRSLFKAPEKEKSQSMDLWADGRPRSPGPLMVDVSGRRSRSLPRSLKSVKQSVSKFVKSRSASTEGRLDDPNNSEHAMRDQFIANEYVTHVVKPKQKGLLRSMTMRMSKSQSSVAVASASSSSSKRTPRAPRSSSKKSKKQQQRSSSGTRPQSLDVRQNVTPSRYRGPIPVSSPMTPQSIHKTPFTPPEPTSLGSGRRLNIPPGKAWRAFGEVNYRQSPHHRHADRQSSSGNWSATESMRYSTDSAQTGSTVPDSSSFSSHDRDSAVFCNTGFPYMGRYAERLTSDTLSTVTSVSDVTTTSVTDDVSTVNGDATTVHDEDSDGTLHGSVLQLPADKEGEKSVIPTDKPPTPDGESTRKSREKRKKRRSRNKNAEANGASVTGLTVQNMKVHDKVFRTTVSGGKVTDDEASLYSVDQDGFYTSMHKDCGLKRTMFDMIEEVPGNVGSKTINGQHVSTKSADQRNKKPPPPPPPRKSSSLSNNQHSLNNQENTSPKQKHSLNNQRIFSQSATSLNSLNDQLDRIQIHSSTLSLASIKSNDSKSSKVSDAELMLERVKNKTNISSAGYPTICTVTPTNSDDEGDSKRQGKSKDKNNDPIVVPNDAPVFKVPQTPIRTRPNLNPICETGYDKTGKALKSADIKLKPGVGPAAAFEKGPRQNSFRMMVNAMLESSYEKSDRSMDDSSISLEFDFGGMDLIDTSVYSTWPRQLRVAPNENEDSENAENVPPNYTTFGTDQKVVINPAKGAFTPKIPLVLADEKGFNTRNVLPDVKTPDDVLDGRPYANTTFTSQPTVEAKFTFPETEGKLVTTMNEEVNKKVTTKTKTKTKKKKHTKSDSRSSKEKIASEVTNISDKPVMNESFDSSTWPKKKSASKSIDDTSSELTNRGYTDPSDKLSWTNSFPRRKNKDRVRSRTVEVPKSLSFGKAIQPLTPIVQSPTNDSEKPLVSSISTRRSNSAGRINMGINSKVSPKKVTIAAEPVQQPLAPTSPNPLSPVASTPLEINSETSALILPTSPTAGNALSPLQAAPARLIISSPVSSQAAYVPNPHRRSVCSPVSERDFQVFSFQAVGSEKSSSQTSQSANQTNCNKGLSPQHVEIPDFINRSVVKSQTMFEFSTSPQKDNTANQCLTPDGTNKPISQPLYTSISAMKHSISFPYSTKHSSDKSNNNSNKTWYDGVDEKDKVKKSPSKKKVEISVNEHRLSSTGYPFAQFLGDGYLCSLDTSEKYEKRWSGYSLISTNSSTSSGSGHQLIEKKSSSSSLSKPADSLSVGSTHSKDSGNSTNSRTSGGSLLSAFKQRRSTADKTTLTLNLKEKCKLKSRGTSASNLPLPSLPSVFGKNKNKEQPIEQKLVEKQEETTTVPLSSTLLSPTKLKRSSAVLDEDFDVFRVEFPESAELNNSIHVGSPPRKSDLIIEYLSSKRQCTSPTNISQNNSPTKISIARRHRLRRSVSKGKLSHNSSFSSTENILKSPSKSPPVEQIKPFATRGNMDSRTSTEHSPIKAPLRGSPKKVQATSNTNSSSTEGTKVFSSPQKQDTKIAKTTKLSTGALEPAKINPTKDLEQYKLGKPSQFSPKKQRETSVETATALAVDVASPSNASPKQSRISRLPTPMKTRSEGMKLTTVGQPVKDNEAKRKPALKSTALFRDKSSPETKTERIVEKAKKSTPQGSHVKTLSSPIEARKSILKTPAPKPQGESMEKVKQSKLGSHSEGPPSLNGKIKPSIERTNTDDTVKRGSITIDKKAKDSETSAFDTLEDKTGVSVKPTPLKFTPPKATDRKPPVIKSKDQINYVKPHKEKSIVKEGDKNKTVSSKSNLLNTPQTQPIRNAKVNVASVVGLKVESSTKEQKQTSNSEESETMNELQPVTSLLKSASTIDLNSSGKPMSRQPSYGSIADLNNQRTTLTLYGTLNKTSSITKSLSNLSCLSLLKDSTSVVYDSDLSLAKSTDSLSSNSTTERNRSAKLAFLSQQEETINQPKTGIDDRFSKHKIGKGTSRTDFSKTNNKQRSSSCSNVKNNTLKLNDQNKLTSIGGLVNGHV